MAAVSKKERTTDHDLLIEVNTKLERVIQDIKDYADNLGGRVTHLEDGKLDKIELDRLKTEFNENLADHEKRIRTIEMWVWGLAGAIAILQFLFPILKEYINK